MHWNDCRSRYRAFISLGSTCQTAHQLKRIGLRRHAGPLDWFVSPSAPDIARLIRNRFAGLMEQHRLMPLGTTLEGLIMRDTAYNIDSYHDFKFTIPGGQTNHQYSGFKQRINRRIERILLSAARHSDSHPLCFIRTQTAVPEAKDLLQAIDGLTGRRAHLLIVNFRMDHQKEVLYEDWGMERICSAVIPGGVDWRGSDEAWNTIMKGFSI